MEGRKGAQILQPGPSSAPPNLVVPLHAPALQSQAVQVPPRGGEAKRCLAQTGTRGTLVCFPLLGCDPPIGGRVVVPGTSRLPGPEKERAQVHRSRGVGC